MEEHMPGSLNGVWKTLPVCGILIITGPAFAQAVEEKAAQEQAAQNEQAAQAESAVQSDAAEQAAQAAPKDLGQGTKAQAEHSAEATAHKSVSDPNNQLGTSLQGRTRPVVNADAKDTNVMPAQNAETPAVEAQATAPESEAAPAAPAEAAPAPAEPAQAEQAPAPPAQ